MKKISLYLSILAAAFVISSCTEDYNADVAAPQSWDQEEAASLSDFTITAASDINLDTATDEYIQLVNCQMATTPDGAELGEVLLSLTSSEDEAATTLSSTAGVVLVEDLQSVVESYYGKASEWRTLLVSATTTLNVEGEAYYMETPAAITVNVLPKTPTIIPEYYIVGNSQGWDPSNKSITFYPVDAAAGTMSITTSLADGNGDAYFKIFSAAQMGSWDNGCYGTEVDGDTSLTGNLVENGGAIQAPSSDIYTLSIDLINNTYEMVLAEDQAPATYSAIGLIGAFNSWNGDAELTEVAPHNWWIEGFVHENSDELKFRANNGWDVNWGAAINIDDVSYGTLEMGGANLTVPAGTYNVYFNDITGQTYFIAQ